MLVGVAVNVTEDPAQMAPGLLMVTAGVRLGLTVIGTEFDVAVVEDRQVPPAMMMSQVNVLPLASVVEV